MDWKIFFTAFVSIFLAELGDKTQIASILLASKTHKPVAVFFGSMIAFAVVTLIAVAAGTVITKFISPSFIKSGSAVAFILVGILILIGKI
ncbi:MAG: TMEM165/GDT1 family protein [Candidatus Brocadiaceae bacterium]|nr:TMEM165/GDT1 family protein [Candidatus Brocadiaceae bacterium]